MPLEAWKFGNPADILDRLRSEKEMEAKVEAKKKAKAKRKKRQRIKKLVRDAIKNGGTHGKRSAD